MGSTIQHRHIKRQFIRALGEDCTVRRYDSDTDDYAETTERLVVESQDITYRPLNKYRTSVIGQPVPIERIVVYSESAFPDFRDIIIWRGERFRVIEISKVVEHIVGLFSTTFIRAANAN